MPPSINQFLIGTATPPIPAARQWLNAYDGRLGPPINLAQAVPGTPPPLELLQRLSAAALDPATTMYGPILGEPGLISVYARHVSKFYNATVAPNEIAITSGCNEAFFVTALAIAKSGDAILLPTPCYFNHEMTLSMLGIEPVPLPARAETGFLPSVKDAERIIQERATNNAQPLRAIVLVTPNNPTGAIYPPTLIAEFVEFAHKHDLWLILDETYRDFLPPSQTPPHHLLSDLSARARIIQLYSFSKSYAIPGHRVGALLAPPALMQEIVKVLDTLQICAPRIGQIALQWAIDGLKDWRDANARDVDERGATFRRSMSVAPHWKITSLGAYFAFVAHPFGALSDVEVAEALAVQCGVLALPGSYFTAASADHLRFAYANVAPDLIAEVGHRIARLRL